MTPAEEELHDWLRGMTGRSNIHHLAEWLLGWAARQVAQERERCGKIAAQHIGAPMTQHAIHAGKNLCVVEIANAIRQEPR